jgi:hypothetical protein
MSRSNLAARWSHWAVAAALVAGTAGCGGSVEATSTAFGSGQTKVTAKRFADGSIDDQSKCEWKGRADREASEVAGPGSVLPNVRRVFGLIGTGPEKQKVLLCREVDTNLDGTKDVYRFYTEKGEALREEADANYDGRTDTWLTFAKGRLAEAKVDLDHDGNPDEWKFYSAGKLTRLKRDSNHDGKPDVWEIYAADGRLERMGVDVDGDERVDRWDHDMDERKKREEKERAEDEAAAKKAQAEAAADAQGSYNSADKDGDGKPDAEPADAKKKGANKAPASKKGADSKKAPPAPPAKPPATPPAK